MKCFYATKVIRLDSDVRKNLEQTLVFLDRMTTDLMALGADTDEEIFYTIEDKCHAAYNDIFSLLSTYDKYEKGEK